MFCPASSCISRDKRALASVVAFLCGAQRRAFSLAQITLCTQIMMMCALEMNVRSGAKNDDATRIREKCLQPSTGTVRSNCVNNKWHDMRGSMKMEWETAA